MSRSRTHCKAGHEYTEANTYITKTGERHCRTCRRERMRARREGGPGRGRKNAEKTHCPRGHPYDAENTAINRGKRACRACARLNARRQVLKKYGLDQVTYEEMMKRQRGCCAVCLMTLVPGSQTHVDHDHSCCEAIPTCGTCNRGLLCGRCNTILGLARDDEFILNNAVEYLRGSRSR